MFVLFRTCNKAMNFLLTFLSHHSDQKLYSSTIYKKKFIYVFNMLFFNQID